VQHADGHWVWIWSRGRTLRDADGTLTDKTVGTHIDVTAGVLAEDDLKKSEEQYRNVVEDQTEFISRFLPDGTHVFVNEAYCRYFGFQRDEILGHPFRPEIPAGDRERLVQFFASLTPDHPVDSIEHRVVLPDDTVRWQRWTDRAIFDASGTVTEYQSVGQDITAKKEAELALQESEGRYRTVFGATGTATVLLENDGTIILANTEYEQLSGYTREEIEGKKKWTEFVVREDLDRMHAQHRLRREDRGAALKHYEFRFISRSGEIRNIYLTADVIPGTKRSVASLLDITDRKLAEESLARSEQQYRSVIENIQDIFYRSDQDGNLIMASPSGAALLGYDSLDEILGKSIAETIYFNPAERAAFLADLQKTGAVSNYETRLKKKDGTPLPVATTSHYYYDESGAVAGVEGILRDITELKEAENSLRESEERFRVLSEAAYEAIAIHEEGVLLNANDQYFKMFGYEPGEALGKQILSMTVAPEAMEFTKQQVATGALGPYESIGVRKDGTRFPIQIRARNVVYEGRHVRFAAIDDITSRKVAEEALRRSEEKYRLLTDNAQDTIWTTDLQFTMTYVNNAIFSLLGYTPQEFVGLRADVWTSPEGMRTIQEAAETLFADFHKGILSRQVLCVNQKKKDGPWLDVEISASLLLNNSGEPVGFQGRSNDITDRKRAEDALHESERSYRTLFNTVRQAIYILDGEGRFVDVNDGAEAMYGYRRDEFVGKTPEFLSAPGKNDLARVSEYLRSAYAGEPQEFEFWGLRKNGDVFPKDVRLYKGIYFGRDVVIAIGTDITGRKMAEEALRGSEEKYRSLFDQSTEGIHLHDLEGRILDVNEVACVQSGYSREELLGRSIFDAHPGKGITNWPKEKILQAWKEWAPGQRFTIEGEHQRKDGTIYPVEISIGKVRYGTTDHILAIVRDITERKMAEEALRTLAEGRHGTEDELLSVLVRQLALSQGVQYALIARIRPDDPGTAHTLAVWAVSDFGDNFRYSLDGTPCENVSVKGTCFYPRDIRQLFPRDQLLADMNAESYWGTPLHDKDGHTIGILAMLDVKPMVEHPQSLALLKSFAIRASLELQGMQAEETLRNKEEYYRTIIQTTKDGFWIIDAHTGRFLDVNETYCKMSGYSRAEVLDMGINDIDSIEDPAKTQERIRRILSNGSEIFETDHRRKDGSTFAAEISVTYFPAEGGKFICFCRDITERKRAEENIRQQTDAMEAAIDGLAILNADQNYTYVNNAHAAIYGYEHARELIGRSWRILYNSDELQRFEQEILPELGQKGHYRGEAIGKKKDGSTFPQEISLTALENGRLICVVRDITGRRLAEERLKESEERYRSLYVDNRDAIMLVSPERGFIAANPAAIQLFSFRNEQDYILCSPASLSPDYQPDGVLSTTKSREMMHLALEKGSNFFEWTHCKSDGTEFPAMVLLSRLENGGTQLLQATVRDISGQKRAEAALEESEEKFRSIAEQLPEVIALTDEAGIITYASPASVTLFGMSGGEMAGRHFTGFVDEASVPAAAATFRDAIQQGRKVVGLEFRMKRGDGSVFDGELFGERYESASGQGTLVTIRDITERRRAQHQLEENRRLLEVAINLAQMATWEYDVKSGMFTFNDRFYELYGTTAEREGGYLMPADVYARQFVHPEDAPLVGIEIQKVLQTHDPEFTSEVEHRIIRRDGETRTIVVRYAVKLDASGNVVMTHGANQDITELRRAEEAVRQANRQLKLLTGITRHDINNQLLVLNSYLALSKKTLGDVDKTREYILREERVAKTIERQILFTKEYEGLGTSTPVWQNVRSCIEPALKGLDLTGIDLDVTGLENIEILADTLIPRVFFNLADNALRHGGEAMTGIRISSRESGTGLVIVFEDDGEGVVAEEKEKIFERGFGKNTGYGLFLTREILGITGITITETGEPGTGARFEMTVPEGMWRRNEMAEDGKVNNP
jgi:PAS domain S-box-containing protein